MKKLLCIAAALLIITGVWAQIKQTVTRSSVTYEIKNMGITTNGKFGGLEASINFDKANLSASSIEATVDVNTLDSDNSMRDNHLKADDYFDAAHYPKITMKSTSFKFKSGNQYTGVFNITIKNKTKAVEVPFTYTDNASVGLFKGSFTINRKDFGIGGNSMVLSNEAKVTLSLETSK